MTDVAAKASMTNALREPVNWLNLLIPSFWVLAGVARLMLASLDQNVWSVVLGLVLTVGGIAWGAYYLRYMGSISFELTAEGFRYEATGRKLYFPWQDIQAFKIQPKVKRLTLWVQGKPQAMQYMGIADGEFNQMYLFLQAKMAEYRIQQK
jgi:hypothetical protein